MYCWIGGHAMAKSILRGPTSVLCATDIGLVKSRPPLSGPIELSQLRTSFGLVGHRPRSILATFLQARVSGIEA